MTKYESYEAVRTLRTAAQRELLARGDSKERVWAAWALAVRIGREASPGVLESARASPPAGVRRHLLVILAGLGERSILRVLAEDDPSPHVRAAGCQYLISTCASDEPDTAEFLKLSLFSDPSAVVREEILKRSTPGLPCLTLADLVRLADDRSAEVRRHAVAMIQDLCSIEEIAASGLLKRLAVEDDPELLLELGRLAIRADGPARVLAGAASQGPNGCLALLDQLIDGDTVFDWSDLAGLAARRDRGIDLRVLRLLDPRSGPVGFAWLAHAIAVRLGDTGVKDWEFLEDAWKPVTDMIDDVPAAVVEPLRPHLQTIAEYAGSVPAPDEDGTPGDDRRARLDILRRRLLDLIESGQGPA